MIDVSESVRGGVTEPAAGNVRDPLQQSASDVIDLMPNGTRFAIIPFSRGADFRNVYPKGGASASDAVPWAEIAGPQDRARAKEFVQGLDAKGQFTWIVDALEYAKMQLQSWKAQSSGQLRRQAIYIYTDGLDNSGRPNWQTRASELLADLRRQDMPHLWAVLVRVGEDAITDCPTGFNGCVTTTSQAPSPSVRVLTPALDFGALSVARPESIRPMELSFRNPGSEPIPLGLELQLEPPLEGVRISPTSAAASDVIYVTLRVEREIGPGSYGGKLVLKSPLGLFASDNRVPLTFRFELSEPRAATPTLAPSSTATPIEVASATPGSGPAAALAEASRQEPLPCEQRPTDPDCAQETLPPAVLLLVGILVAGVLDNLVPRYEQR